MLISFTSPLLRKTLLALALAASLGSAQAVETSADAPTVRMRIQELSQRASDLAMSAIGFLGIRYKLGGTDAATGLDCSGLVRLVFQQSWGKELPRTSEEISRVGEKIDVKDLQPGDLVFFNTVRRAFSHVGIYLGDSKFIHSPRAGAEVRIESMDVGYWKQRFNGARRIDDSGS